MHSDQRHGPATEPPHGPGRTASPASTPYARSRRARRCPLVGRAAFAVRGRRRFQPPAALQRPSPPSAPAAPLARLTTPRARLTAAGTRPTAPWARLTAAGGAGAAAGGRENPLCRRACPPP